jgi:hypothetical protein
MDNGMISLLLIEDAKGVIEGNGLDRSCKHQRLIILGFLFGIG